MLLLFIGVLKAAPGVWTRRNPDEARATIEHHRARRGRFFRDHPVAGRVLVALAAVGVLASFAWRLADP